MLLRKAAGFLNLASKLALLISTRSIMKIKSLICMGYSII